ncbi:hypothetical protein Ptr902_01976 [Pyrenophora tritici-repentis]|nr:hypothetical protein Ptr902_01976 [Pyrenophora tritici-repentis]
MEIEAPTFNALDKPQRRAFILRDQLRFLDPQHLNEFLSNVSNDEPPTYTKVNGLIKPPLTLVTLKEEAKRFDLGNVYLPENDNNVYRVHLVVENRQIQLRAEDPLPLDEDVLDSCPIHGFIARGMVPLFKEKFQSIYARKHRLNEARRAAYKMVNQPPTLSHEGESLLRLHPNAEQGSVASNPKRMKKRERNEPVVPHVSNKRNQIGFNTIPEEAKSRTFDTIPNHVKIGLFNSIAKTAFPSFDNLMTAGWNIVSIYSACGSEFPDLHSAIVVLKNVLQDFDEAFGRRGDRTTPGYRYDFGGPSRAGPSTDRDGHDREVRSVPPPMPTSAASQDQIAQSFDQATIKLQDDPEAPVEDLAHVEHEEYHRVEQETEENAGQKIDQEAEQEVHQEEDQEASPESAPVLQLAELHQDQIEDDDSGSGDDEIPAFDPRLSGIKSSDEDSRLFRPQYIPETGTGGSPLRSVHSSSDGQYANAQRDGIQNTRQEVVETDPNVRAKSIPQATTSALVRHREGNISTVSKTNANPELHNASIIRSSLIEPAHVESECDQSSRNQKRAHIRELSIGALEEKIRERTEKLIKVFGSVENAPDPHKDHLQKLEDARQLKLQEESDRKAEADNDNDQGGSHTVAELRRMFAPANHGMFGKYLGNSSVHGVQRTRGIAPVAPMYPNAARDPRDAMSGVGRPGGTPPSGVSPSGWRGY